MTTIAVECPDDLLSGLRMEPAEFSAWMQLRAAVDLVNRGKITTGMAARWLGWERLQFIQRAYGEGLVFLSEHDAVDEKALM